MLFFARTTLLLISNRITENLHVCKFISRYFICTLLSEKSFSIFITKNQYYPVPYLRLPKKKLVQSVELEKNAQRFSYPVTLTAPLSDFLDDPYSLLVLFINGSTGLRQPSIGPGKVL